MIWKPKNLIMYNTNDVDLLICECNSPEHSVLVFFDDDDNYPLVYFEVHLKKISWYKRVLYGIKYIFGYQSKYGAFDTFIFKHTDTEKIEKIVRYLKKRSVT